VPFLQTVSRMDLRLMPTELSVTKVLSNGGIPLDVHAIANIKVTSHPQYTYNAVERFLTLPPEAIHMTAKQTLEGALRDVISQLTPEQVNEDRIEFANRLLETTSEVFDKLGLHLDTLKIQRVEDEAKYLVNIARTRQAAELAQKQAEIGVSQKRNELRALVGQLEGAAQAVEREAVVAAEQARAEAEQELQTLRQQLETKRLQCEVVLPAEAARKGAELLAQGAAAQQREQGLATAETTRAMAQALATAGSDAREMFVLSQLDTLVAKVAEKVKEVTVGEVQVIDGGDGRALPALAASFPAVVGSVFGTLKELTGVDVQSMLASTGTGGAR
jgi:flotillin